MMLLKNPIGLGSLITCWVVGAAYFLAASLDLVDGANVPLVLKFCGIGGVVLFFGMPILNRLFKP
jgi:hypothetical protein